MSILNNESIIKDTRREIIGYLQENKNSLVEPTLVWDAVKVIMRGWSMMNVAREVISQVKEVKQQI